MQLSVKMPPSQNYLMNPLPMEPVSRTYQYRKIMKPMLERKRRARINKCLDELKDLMTGTLQADGENVSKLEKADILELTVRHLQRLRENNALFVRNTESINMEKFWAGFQHCAVEVSQFLNKYDQSISGDLYKHIANYIPHLATAAANYQRMASVQLPKMSINSTAATTSSNQPNLTLRAMPTNLVYIPRMAQTTTPVGISLSLQPSVGVSGTLSASNLPMSSSSSSASASSSGSSSVTCLQSVDTKPIRQMLSHEPTMTMDMNQRSPALASTSTSAAVAVSVPLSNDDGLRYHPYAKVIKTEGGGVWRPW